MQEYLKILGILICSFNCWALETSADTKVIVSAISVWSLIISNHLDAR